MNQLIRVTKEFNFEMAHALWNYDGACKTIHGHSYKLYVTVKGKPLKSELNTKFGMVIDFGDLKTIVNKTIVDEFDHALLIYKKSDLIDVVKKSALFDKLKTVDYQPTCENLVIDIVQRIKEKLSTDITLHSVKLYETATSYAEWYQDDNS